MALALRSPAADLSVIAQTLQHFVDPSTGTVARIGFVAALLKAMAHADGSASAAERKMCAAHLYPLFVDDAAAATGATALDIVVALSTECTAGGFSFMYRYILRESCSQFDLLPLTYFTRTLQISTRLRTRCFGRSTLRAAEA